MKRIGFLVAFLVAVVVLSGVAVAFGVPGGDKANENASASDNAEYMTGGELSPPAPAVPPGLASVTFIHWKEGFAKPPCNKNGICEPELGENPSCADCKNGEEEPPPTATCYAFLGQYGKRLLKWGELPVDYVINPINLDGLSATFVAGAISAGAEEWDANTGGDLFGSYTTDKTVTYRVQDYVNAISFGNYYLDTNIIGAATVWYNPATKAIVEFDVIFETDWTWGDATNPETPDVMDLQNIAVHELGHGVGLADVYEAECGAVTMYGESDYGETQKRTLEQPDITGIQKLYGP